MTLSGFRITIRMPLNYIFVWALFSLFKPIEANCILETIHVEKNAQYRHFKFLQLWLNM